MPVTVDVCVCTHRNCIQHHLLHFCSPVYGPPQEEHREMWKTIETNCVYACGGGDDRVLAGCSERTIIRSENTASHSWNMYVHSPDDHSRRALNERESDCCLAWPDERNEHLLRRVFALMVGRLPTAHAVQHVGWCDVRYGKESSPCARGKLHLPSVERHSMRMDADDASVRRCVNISFGDGHSRACCRMLSDAAVAAHTPFIPAWRVRRNVAAEWTLRQYHPLSLAQNAVILAPATAFTPVVQRHRRLPRTLDHNVQPVCCEPLIRKGEQNFGLSC